MDEVGTRNNGKRWYINHLTCLVTSTMDVKHKKLSIISQVILIIDGV